MKTILSKTPGAARFDMEMLETSGTTEVRTTTPWTDGVQRFEGVLFRRLLEAVALNDYAVEIPVADSAGYRVIVALKANGKYLRIRDKGPLWVVYPWDDHEELRSEDIFAKSIWQLKELKIN